MFSPVSNSIQVTLRGGPDDWIKSAVMVNSTTRYEVPEGYKISSISYEEMFGIALFVCDVKRTHAHNFSFAFAEDLKYKVIATCDNADSGCDLPVDGQGNHSTSIVLALNNAIVNTGSYTIFNEYEMGQFWTKTGLTAQNIKFYKVDQYGTTTGGTPIEKANIKSEVGSYYGELAVGDKTIKRPFRVVPTPPSYNDVWEYLKSHTYVGTVIEDGMTKNAISYINNEYGEKFGVVGGNKNGGTKDITDAYVGEGGGPDPVDPVGTNDDNDYEYHVQSTYSGFSFNYSNGKVTKIHIPKDSYKREYVLTLQEENTLTPEQILEKMSDGIYEGVYEQPGYNTLNRYYGENEKLVFVSDIELDENDEPKTDGYKNELTIRSVGYKSDNTYLVATSFNDVLEVTLNASKNQVLSINNYNALCVAPHEHDWDYSVNGNKIEAYCKNENCPSGTDATHKVSLTLSATSQNYSGSAVTASLSDTTAWIAAGLTVPAIEYYQGTAKLDAAPVNPGKYTAKITVEGKTASVDFEITKKDEPAPPTPSPTAPSPTAPTESYTIPIKGDETVQISANIENGIAKVDEISKKNITKALDDKSKTKTTKITIDLSGATQEVTGVTLTKSTVNNLLNAVSDKSNKLTSVEVSLSNATVVINEKALKAIKNQANGSDINLVVDDVAKAELNSAQQTELEKHEVATVFEAYFESNGKRIHDFKGGNVILSIDFKPAKGKSKKNYHVYYVADNGKMTLYNTRYMNGRLQFTTTHFSDYAIVYDENKVNATGKADESTAMKMNAGLKVSQTGKALNIAWGKAGDADGYNIYAAYCGEPFKKVKSVSAAVTSAKLTKLNGKPLNLKKNFKVYIKAYQIVSGKKVEYSKTISAHVVGSKNLKYSNAKDINVSFKSLTLKKGKTKSIKAKTVLVNPARRQLSNSHASEFRYAKSDPKVASVNKNGKITAKSKGSCNIYVYAKNGYAKKIAVKVK